MPQLEAAATTCGTCTHVQIISDDGHRANTRAVCVVRLISTADSRTERLCLLLTAPKSSLYRSYVLYLAVLMSAGFPKK